MPKTKVKLDSPPLRVADQPYVMIRMPPEQRQAFKSLAFQLEESQQKLAKKALVLGLKSMGHKID